MLVWPVDDHLFELLEVPRGDGLGVGELLGKHEGHADLIGADVWVGRDDGATRVVHSLAHHVLAKQPILLLKQLGQRSNSHWGVIRLFSGSEMATGKHTEHV